jgi:hypothetical protein
LNAILEILYTEISYPIHLFMDPNDIHPSFTINKLIDKRSLINMLN